MCFSTFQRLPLCNARRLWFDCARIPCCCIFFSLLVLQKKEERQNWQGIGCAFVGPEKRRRIYISLSMFLFECHCSISVLCTKSCGWEKPFSILFIFLYLCHFMQKYDCVRGTCFLETKKTVRLGFLGWNMGTVVRFGIPLRRIVGFAPSMTEQNWHKA